MDNENKKCKVCGSIYIQNKKLQLCSECIYKKNHSGKSRQEVYAEKKKNNIKSIVSGKNANKNFTGEKEMFLQIWECRPHFCVNCGKFLGNEPKAFFFSHRQSKGANPSKKLDKLNIDLLCWECHQARDFGSGIKIDK